MKWSVINKPHYICTDNNNITIEHLNLPILDYWRLLEHITTRNIPAIKKVLKDNEENITKGLYGTLNFYDPKLFKSNSPNKYNRKNTSFKSKVLAKYLLNKYKKGIS